METHIIVGSKLYVIKKSIFDILYQKYKQDCETLEFSQFVLRDSIHNDFLDSLVKKSLKTLNIENVYDYV
jgi:hypothetical protein